MVESSIVNSGIFCNILEDDKSANQVLQNHDDDEVGQRRRPLDEKTQKCVRYESNFEAKGQNHDPREQQKGDEEGKNLERNVNSHNSHCIVSATPNGGICIV